MIVEIIDDSLLTEKEIEVIQLMADGHSNKTMAGRVSFKESSLETIRQRIYRRLGVKNGCECVAKCLREGIIK